MQDFVAQHYSTGRTNLLKYATWLAVGMFVVAMFMAFVYAGPERIQGDVQRLFYIHLGTFFGAFFLFLGAVVAGIQYLRTRQERWDDLGHAAIEIGLGFATVNIVTGMIWGKPIWNTWWTWDPRLTTAAIMWLTYAAYLMLRNGIESIDQRRRFAAVYGILAFSSVLLTIIIIRVRPDTIHPVAAGPTSTSDSMTGDFDMTNTIRNTVLFNIVAFTYISMIVTWHRIRLENLVRNIDIRKMKLIVNSQENA
jgi:heme exporter protein C